MVTGALAIFVVSIIHLPVLRPLSWGIYLAPSHSATPHAQRMSRADTLCCRRGAMLPPVSCQHTGPVCTHAASRRRQRGAHLKSLGQHFSLGQSLLWLSACASSWTLFVLTISRRQFWHCGALARSPDAEYWRRRAYNRRGLRGLDRKAVRLDGRAGASLVGGLVLALDLARGSVGARRGICGQHTLSFLEMGMAAGGRRVVGVRGEGGECAECGQVREGQKVRIGRQW
jgi:hypothetical protein